MLPWSVIPRAGCPSAAAAATTSSTRDAPSSIENSVWTWRWAKLSDTSATHLLDCPHLVHSGCPPSVDGLHRCCLRGREYQLQVRTWAVGTVGVLARRKLAAHVFEL